MECGLTASFLRMTPIVTELWNWWYSTKEESICEGIFKLNQKFWEEEFCEK